MSQGTSGLTLAYLAITMLKESQELKYIGEYRWSRVARGRGTRTTSFLYTNSSGQLDYSFPRNSLAS